MFQSPAGEKMLVVDAHVHLWDASPSNQRNRHGAEFINCFYDFHRLLSPAEYSWPLDKFQKYDPVTMYHDLFELGHVDIAICQPTYLTEFYREGFNTTEQNARMKELYPDRFILNGAFDPRDGDAGLEHLHALAENYGIKGVKLYTAEWRGSSKGYKLSDSSAQRYLERCSGLGIKNIHVHKGLTIYPLNLDAFDVRDVDDAATSFPQLNFIVDHVGLPRLDEFCWIAAQEPNVYGGLAAVLPFINARPSYFAHIMAELLFWLGEDRLLFGSDYAIWQPRWIIDKFMAFELPEDLQKETGRNLTLECKRKILGGNAARLYGINLEAGAAKLPE